MQKQLFSILAILWLLALSAFELTHFVQGKPWPGYTDVVNYISFFHIAVWLLGCFQLARYRMNRPVLPMLAFADVIIHGVAIRVGAGWQGFVLIPSGVALLILGFYSLHSQAAQASQVSELNRREAA